MFKAEVDCSPTAMPDMWTQGFTSEYGICITMDQSKSPSPEVFTATTAGRGEFASKMVLTLDADESLSSPFKSRSSGLVVQVHPVGETPMPAQKGMLLAPGQNHALGLTKHTFTRLGVPYGTCIDSTTNADELSGSGTLGECLEASKWGRVMQDCNCSWEALEPFVPASDLGRHPGYEDNRCGACVEDPFWLDATDYNCDSWRGYICDDGFFVQSGFTAEAAAAAAADVRKNCPIACHTGCVDEGRTAVAQHQCILDNVDKAGAADTCFERCSTEEYEVTLSSGLYPQLGTEAALASQQQVRFDDEAAWLAKCKGLAQIVASGALDPPYTGDVATPGPGYSSVADWQHVTCKDLARAWRAREAPNQKQAVRDASVSVELYFNERKVVRYAESPAMTFVDLISGLGGLLGLFLGFSVISIVELLEFVFVSAVFWLPGRRVHQLNNAPAS